ncbi:MAG: hypothetical protein DCC58_07525 [Chloroflexi bacterium]|nr:MAG: hypothetical protein DCC58_07525 [Chloroflexota bacterium]
MGPLTKLRQRWTERVSPLHPEALERCAARLLEHPDLDEDERLRCRMALSDARLADHGKHVVGKARDNRSAATRDLRDIWERHIDEPFPGA